MLQPYQSFPKKYQERKRKQQERKHVNLISSKALFIVNGLNPGVTCDHLVSSSWWVWSWEGLLMVSVADVTERKSLSEWMTSAKVVEMSVTTTDNILSQDYTHPDSRTTRSQSNSTVCYENHHYTLTLSASTNASQMARPTVRDISQFAPEPSLERRNQKKMIKIESSKPYKVE